MNDLESLLSRLDAIKKELANLVEENETIINENCPHNGLIAREMAKLNTELLEIEKLIVERMRND